MCIRDRYMGNKLLLYNQKKKIDSKMSMKQSGKILINTTQQSDIIQPDVHTKNITSYVVPQQQQQVTYVQQPQQVKVIKPKRTNNWWDCYNVEQYEPEYQPTRIHYETHKAPIQVQPPIQYLSLIHI
eukprot:TRINITY_DN310_c0_g1_i9.p1 TRINITY_DN310_c0_g1~~TRINITY_DN310_c0_g1_i9.p1  ORF type:complete len:127 (+),score=42.29 TRINITY_DN310_c0_g1_i9:66-446(+)